MSRKDGGAAFPTIIYYDDKPVGSRDGKTLRDWFAGQFLSSFHITTENGMPAENIAKICYVMADAMLAERDK